MEKPQKEDFDSIRGRIQDNLTLIEVLVSGEAPYCADLDELYDSLYRDNRLTVTRTSSRLVHVQCGSERMTLNSSNHDAVIESRILRIRGLLAIETHWGALVHNNNYVEMTAELIKQKEDDVRSAQDYVRTLLPSPGGVEDILAARFPCLDFGDIPPHEYRDLEGYSRRPVPGPAIDEGPR